MKECTGTATPTTSSEARCKPTGKQRNFLNEPWAHRRAVSANALLATSGTRRQPQPRPAKMRGISSARRRKRALDCRCQGLCGQASREHRAKRNALCDANEHCLNEAPTDGAMMEQASNRPHAAESQTPVTSQVLHAQKGLPRKGTTTRFRCAKLPRDWFSAPARRMELILGKNESS